MRTSGRAVQFWRGSMIFVALIFAGLANATTYYTYDNLGRVTQATESNGTTTQYTYDADGNMTSITRVAGTSVLSIGSVSTSSGAPGSSIIITGSGFNTIASQNTVTFNGVAGVVTYASGNRIVVTVPDGASTGTLEVTTPAGSTTSSTPFTVVPVSITGFSPTIGAAGAAVTVSGGGYDSTITNDSVSLNGTAATVTTATTKQLQFTVPSAAVTGHISVATTLGSAVSGGVFLVPATGYAATDINDVTQLTFGGVGHIFTMSAPNKVSVAIFDGTAGQAVTVVLNNVNDSGTYKVFAPDGSLFTSGSYTTGDSTVDLPSLPSAGTYCWYFVPAGTGSATIRIVTDAVGNLPTDGTPVPVALAAGQNGTYRFTGVAGQFYSLQLTQLTTTPTSGRVNATILKSDGTVQATCGEYDQWVNPPGNCDFSLPASGTYRVKLDPPNMYAASFNVLLSQDFSATLSAGTPGPTVNVNLVPGQHARLQFNATAGQTLALYIGAVSILPANSSVSITVLGPTGAFVDSETATSSSGATFNLTNLLAGTYSVQITPNNQNSAAASMPVKLATGLVATVPVDSAAHSYQTSVPAQLGYFTFPGTAGQYLSLALTQLTQVPASTDAVQFVVTKPDGSSLTSVACYTSASPGCQLSLPNLSQTGNYQITAKPVDATAMSFAITLSADVTGSLSLGNSSSIILGSAGSNAALSFTVTAGQPMSLRVGSLTTTPPGSSVVFYVYDSNGNRVAQTTLTANGTFDLGSLPAGNYTLLVTPNNAATGSMQLTLSPNSTGTLTTDGAPGTFSTSTVGVPVTLSFSATAGQSLSLALTGLQFTNGSSPSATVSITAPDGTAVATPWTCTTSGSGCEIHIPNLTQTGTYGLAVQPTGQATERFTAALSVDAGGTATLGTTMSLSMSKTGQSATVNFTLTSVQTIQVVASSVVTSPAGSIVNYTVTNSSGVKVAGENTSSSAETLTMLSLPAGQYTVTLIPSYPFTTTLQLAVNQVVGGLIPNTTTGSGTSYTTTTPGQSVYLGFTANAGDNISLAVTQFTIAPTYANGAFNIYGPDGYLTSLTCYNSPGNCVLRLRNLAKSGLYTITAVPGQGVQATMAFTFTLSTDVAGTLTPSTPTTVTLPAVGQGASYTFTLGSPQTVALVLDAITTAPAGLSLYTVTLNSAGSSVGQPLSPTTSGTVNLQNLAAGTYTVVVAPSTPSTATFNLTLFPGVTPALSFTTSGSGTTVSTPGPGQEAYLTFTASAGANISLAITNISMSPTISGNAATFSVRAPNGDYLTPYISNCPPGGAGCVLHLRGLPQTGVYTINAHPNNQATMTFSAALSLDVTGTLTMSTPLTVALPASGQGATLSFSLASPQTIALNLGSAATTPANTPLSATVYNSSNAPVGNSFNSTSSPTFNQQNLPAGNYTVAVAPNAPMTGSFQMTLVPQAGGALTTTGSGTGTSLTTPVPGQYIYMTFPANVGDNYALAFTNYSVNPASSGISANILVFPPTGNDTVGNTQCNTSATVCEIHLKNLQQAGTYTIQIAPTGGNGVAAMSLTTTLSADAAGSLTPNTTLPVNLTAMGQCFTVTFTTTATQTVTLTYAPVSLTPSTFMIINVYNNSTNANPGSINTASGNPITMTNLPAGTYSVVGIPNVPATGSLQLNYH